MTAETETKTVEQVEEKKIDDVKEEVKKEELAATEAEEKTDDKAEKEDKEKKEDKPEKPKKEPAPPKPTVHKADYQQDIVYLYQFMRTPVIPSLSPYCLKVETWLRLVGLKYENVDHKMKFRSKKGQLPFIELNGEEIADSAIIIKQLSDKFNTDLDASLTPEQKLVAHSNIHMIEHHFAWVVKWWRCRSPSEWMKAAKLNLQQSLNTRIPNAVLNFAFKLRFKQAAKKVRAHGIGVHKPEEIEEFGKSDLKVLSDLLGKKDFFFGDEPSTMDVVAFANLAQLVYMDPEVRVSLREYLLEHCGNLNGLCRRMQERAFPDWEEIKTTLDLNTHLPKPPPEEEKKEEAAEPEKEETKEEKKDEDKETDEKEKAEKEKEKEEVKEEDNKKAEENEKK